MRRQHRFHDVWRWALVGLCLAGSPAFAAEVQFLNQEGAATELPFSEAVRVDDTLYLSGQLGVKPGTLTRVPGGIEAEARQTMENIRAVLQRNGLDMGNVVKCTVMLVDMAEWQQFNAVYRQFFEAPFPARSAFGASGIGLGGRVEVECIAAYPEASR
ncbi:RidA family protein [Parahaliea aestuarii]|uniref:RidA family protein n=1 Tax=Parahaliea aestuarii TaxID=1852021 RepID=A0A5C9A0Q9_9GAMM|nr:Rid family detoxifying hydrolase [Parahaliea aestuarii]TXS93472.1 RidA family protein [Parahaliea aestuarii]